jgi:biotin carboxyl carrier protein
MSSHEVLTPVPGTFYRRPDPETGPFKSEGDDVAVGDTIGLVEIMKNFHEIKAETAGRITEFLVDNEDAVSAGQVVAVVDGGP